MNTFVTFRIIFFAAILALSISPPIFWLARRRGWVDVPESAPHKQHGTPVPFAGGLILLITILVVSILYHLAERPAIQPILVAAGIIFLFGIWDDFRGLPAYVKLIGQVLATTVLIYLGVQVRLFPQNWLNYALTIFWMVGITNAYNFVDSSDGLALGLAGLASAFFMLVTIDSQQNSLSFFSTVLMGACLGCFFYNTSPAYYFLGDSGSQMLGFILAALGVAYNPLGFERLASWFVPILLVGVPIFDATLVVFSRLRRNKSVYRGAVDHTYHRLVRRGMSPNRAIITMHIAAVLLGCLAFVALPLPPLVANAIFGLVLLAGVGGIFLLDRNYEV